MPPRGFFSIRVRHIMENILEMDFNIKMLRLHLFWGNPKSLILPLVSQHFR